MNYEITTYYADGSKSSIACTDEIAMAIMIFKNAKNHYRADLIDAHTGELLVASRDFGEIVYNILAL